MVLTRSADAQHQGQLCLATVSWHRLAQIVPTTNHLSADDVVIPKNWRVD
jgi:hypothetical protein